MKKLISFLTAVLIAPGLIFGTIQELKDGDHIGVKSTDKLGFYGKTPAVRPANTASAYNAMVTLGLIAGSGADPSVPLALNHVQVTLSAAEIITLYSAGKQLVAAQGSGKSIIVSKVAFTIVRTSTAFASGGVGIIQYGSTVHGGGTQACDSTLASTVFTGSAGTSVSFRNGAVISDAASTVTQNVALYIGAQTGDFTTGTGTATVDVWFYVY